MLCHLLITSSEYVRHWVVSIRLALDRHRISTESTTAYMFRGFLQEGWLKTEGRDVIPTRRGISGHARGVGTPLQLVFTDSNCKITVVKTFRVPLSPRCCSGKPSS